MDADGEVLVAQGERTVAGFNRTLRRVNEYLALEKQAAAGDPSVAAELLIAKLGLGRIDLDEAKARAAKLTGLTDTQRDQIETRIAALEMQRLLARAEAYYQAGRWAQASAAYTTITEKDPDNALAWFNLGYALHAQGKLEEALPAHLKAASMPGAGRVIGMYNAACAYALLGQKDQAFEWLKKSAQAGFKDAAQLEMDTDLDSLRNDPRYKEILTLIKGG